MFLSALTALSQAGTPGIEYGIHIRSRSGEATEVHLHLAVEDDGDGETVLRLPSGFLSCASPSRRAPRTSRRS